MSKTSQSRLFDLSQLLITMWQKQLRPLFERLSVRVNRRGLYWITAVAIWIIVEAFINLLGITHHLGGQNLGGFLTVLNSITVAIGIILAIVLLIDYSWLLRATRQHSLKSLLTGLKITRDLPSNLSVQAWTTVNLSLSHPSPPSLDITLTDNYPLLASTEQLPVHFDSQTLSKVTDTTHQNPLQLHQLLVSYQMFSHERGDAFFDGVDMLLATRIGLLQKFIHIPESAILGSHHARVLANFADIAQGQLAGVSNQTAMSGIIKQRRKGHGQDFHQIRNYTQGDSIRHLDWKASSRYQRLMTREYQDERDQQILFLLDCGQHMRHIRFFEPHNRQRHDKPPMVKNTHLPQGSHLDQALNAMLLLADVANRQGDATGFISFAGDNNKVVSPKKGSQVISYLLNQSFDIQPSNQTPDYLAVARQVRQVQKKRALIILITNTRQEEQHELIEAIGLLATKNMVILANLYEQDLQDYLATLPNNLNQALTYHSVQEYMNTREQLHVKLSQKTNVYSINTTPNQLPNHLITQYFLIKQRHHL